MPLSRKPDVSRLKLIFDERRISTGESVRHLHAHDESYHTLVLPDVVVWPRTTEEVSRLVRWAYGQKMPVTPWGAGTSLEGNPIPVKEGMVIDFQEMNKIMAIKKEDFQVDVEAGVIYKDLNKTLSRDGLFFPPDPGAAATIGGMIGNNASGIRTVKYGATKDYVMRLTVVLPGGDVLHLGNRARKSSSGYNLIALFVGSEGTLGVITEATLRLVGLPMNFMAVRTAFPDVVQAARTVFEIMNSGLSPSAMELLDGNVVRVLNQDRNLSLEEMPMLLMEFHGYSEKGLEEEMAFVEAICKENGAVALDRGIGSAERSRLWEIRHQTLESIKRAHPGNQLLIMDVAVPLSHFSDMIAYVKSEVKDLAAYVFGHAGDGNIHVVVMDDPQNLKRWAKVAEANNRIVLRALEFEGTCTGEHGIGIGKCRFLPREHGEGLDLMKQVKFFLDPEGLMNPGKFF